MNFNKTFFIAFQDKLDQNLKKTDNTFGKKAFIDDEKKGLKLFRLSNERGFRFPIRPPKLKKVNNSSDISAQRSRIGYASALQTRQTDINSTFTGPIRKVKKIKRRRLHSRPQNQVSRPLIYLFEMFSYGL